MNMNYRIYDGLTHQTKAAAVSSASSTFNPTSSAFNPAPDFLSSSVSSLLLPSPVHISLGAYGRCPHHMAIEQALKGCPADPLIGALSTAKLQLCPQNRGRIDSEMVRALRLNHPEIEWRLHANVQVDNQARIVDLCDWRDELYWFAQVSHLSSLLSAPAYTAHAGRRGKSSLTDVLRYTLEAEQLFGIPVGIEGHYPTKHDIWLLSTWQEYQQLLESGVHYALDLSHLHIVATASGRIEWGLVRELLASPKCLEVHLSGNDGSADQHHALGLEGVPWWWSLLTEVNPDAVLFSEGRQNTVSSIALIAA
jgi:hypothetical protein